jgi:UDP-2-acetamido-3-amino-2,3-dideoxy-glucuronate N-acetyltransferase
MRNIRIAQVGVGYWGRNLARNFAKAGNLVAVADFHAPTAEKIAAEHDTVVRSLDDILADPEIDGIGLATPAVTHADLAVRALAAGKHVFVEKPLALNQADAERVIFAADRAGRLLMVGHLLQYHPIFIRLREIVVAGELGQLRYIYSNRLSLGKYRVAENVLWSFAPHDISMLLALTGEAPATIEAHGASFVTPGVADWAVVNLGFPSGVRGHVNVSWSHPFKEQRLVVVGDEGMAVFEDSNPDWDKRLAIYRHGLDRSGPEPVPVAGQAEYPAVERAEPLLSECKHFVDCIAHNRQPKTDGREGARVLDVLERAEASLARSLSGGRL